MNTLFALLMALVLLNSSVLAAEEQTQMQQAINCAALIATDSSLQSGTLTSDSEAYKQIGYTLGQAEIHASNAGIVRMQVKKQYDRKVVNYFSRFISDSAGFNKHYGQQLQLCQQQSRLYDPATQMQAIMEKARQLQSEQ